MKHSMKHSITHSNTGINNEDDFNTAFQYTKNLIKQTQYNKSFDLIGGYKSLNSLSSNSPITNAPITNSPITNSPITNAPITNAPITNAPITNAPITNAPITNSLKSFEQSGGAHIQMNTNTVFTAAQTNNTTQPFYILTENLGIYMRGEIIGNKLEVNLISVVNLNGHRPLNGNPPQHGININVCTNPPNPWTKNVFIPNANHHLIEIKDDGDIYTQHHLATAGIGGDKYKFCKNINPGQILLDMIPVYPAIRGQPGKVYGASDANPVSGKAKDFLFVDLSKIIISKGSVDRTIPPVNEIHIMTEQIMTEQIINFLLHQLVQYKLAKTIFCRYESNKVTKITVENNQTLTSYTDYNNIRFANELHNNVFSQCFEYYDKFDKKKKLVHAITQLEPSDSAINMKDCSIKDINSLCNLTKVLAISNPFTRKLNNEESIFYLALRIHTLDININGFYLVDAQHFAGDYFISGTFCKSIGVINLNRLNNLSEISKCPDYIRDGDLGDFIDNGIGRFVVKHNEGDLMIYDAISKKNVSLVSYGFNENGNNKFFIQPYERFTEHTKVKRDVSRYPFLKICRDNTNTIYQLIAINIHLIYTNEYDITTPADTRLSAVGTFAMHVCTATTTECNSITSLADELNS